MRVSLFTCAGVAICILHSLSFNCTRSVPEQSGSRAIQIWPNDVDVHLGHVAKSCRVPQILATGALKAEEIFGFSLPSCPFAIRGSYSCSTLTPLTKTNSGCISTHLATFEGNNCTSIWPSAASLFQIIRLGALMAQRRDTVPQHLSNVQYLPGQA